MQRLKNVIAKVSLLLVGALVVPALFVSVTSMAYADEVKVSSAEDLAEAIENTVDGDSKTIVLENDIRLQEQLYIGDKKIITIKGNGFKVIYDAVEEKEKVGKRKKYKYYSNYLSIGFSVDDATLILGSDENDKLTICSSKYPDDYVWERHREEARDTPRDKSVYPLPPINVPVVDSFFSVYSGGELIMNSGVTVTHALCKSVVYVTGRNGISHQKSSFLMVGGSITNSRVCSGSVVKVMQEGVFNMQGGHISKNTSFYKERVWKNTYGTNSRDLEVVTSSSHEDKAVLGPACSIANRGTTMISGDSVISENVGYTGAAILNTGDLFLCSGRIENNGSFKFAGESDANAKGDDKVWNNSERVLSESPKPAWPKIEEGGEAVFNSFGGKLYVYAGMRIQGNYSRTALASSSGEVQFYGGYLQGNGGPAVETGSYVTGSLKDGALSFHGPAQIDASLVKRTANLDFKNGLVSPTGQTEVGPQDSVNIISNRLEGSDTGDIGRKLVFGEAFAGGYLAFSSNSSLLEKLKPVIETKLHTDDYRNYVVLRGDSQEGKTLTVSLAGGESGPKTFDWGSMVTFPQGAAPVLPKLSAPGFKFLGWFADSEGNKEFDPETINDKGTVYAKWKRLHKVEFRWLNPVDSSPLLPLPSTQYVDEGEKVLLTGSPLSPWGQNGDSSLAKTFSEYLLHYPVGVDAFGDDFVPNGGPSVAAVYERTNGDAGFLGWFSDKSSKRLPSDGITITRDTVVYGKWDPLVANPKDEKKAVVTVKWIDGFDPYRYWKIPHEYVDKNKAKHRQELGFAKYAIYESNTRIKNNDGVRPYYLIAGESEAVQYKGVHPVPEVRLFRLQQGSDSPEYVGVCKVYADAAGTNTKVNFESDKVTIYLGPVEEFTAKYHGTNRSIFAKDIKTLRKIAIATCSYTVPEKEVFSLGSLKIPTPIMKGMRFLGWVNDGPSSSSRLAPFAPGDRSYVSRWGVESQANPPLEVNIEYGWTKDSVDDADRIKVLDPQRVKYGNPLPAPYLEADGYKFDGWYYDQEGKDPVLLGAGAYENRKIYGKWSKDSQ